MEDELASVRVQHSAETEELLTKFEDAQQLSAYVSSEMDSLTAQLAAEKADNGALSRQVESLRALQQQVRSAAICPLARSSFCV